MKIKKIDKLVAILITAILVITTLNAIPIIKNLQSEEKLITTTIESNNDLIITSEEIGDHIVPFSVYIYPEQIGPNNILVGLLAIYENCSAIFLINRTEQFGNNITIFVDSIFMANNSNDTSEAANAVIENLSVGSCYIEVVENILNTSISTITFNLLPYYIFLHDNETEAGLETFVGGKVNDTVYLLPNYGVPTLPPALFQYTCFWANSTDDLYLAINLSNIGVEKNNVTFSLYDSADDIEITPNIADVGLINESSYKICLFEIILNDVDHGIYNLTYYYNYTVNQTNYCLIGSLPMGVYILSAIFCSSPEWENSSVNATLITPFNDTLFFNSKDWQIISIENGTMILPFQTNYTANWSQFSIQEPHSPFLHILIGAAAGAVAGAVSTIVTSVVQGKPIDWKDVAISAGVGALAGGLVAATCGAAGAAVVPLTAKSIGIGMAKTAVVNGVLSAGFDAGFQLLTTGTIDARQTFATGIGGAVGGAAGFATGALLQPAAAALHVRNVMKSGGFDPTGPYNSVNTLWESGNYYGATHKYLTMASNLNGINAGTKCYLAYENYRKISTGATLLKNMIMFDWKLSSTYNDEGISGAYESTYANNPFSSNIFSQGDADGDGIPNIVEMQSGTNPFDYSDAPITIEILSPTSLHPAIVGDPTNPLSFITTVATSFPIYNPEFVVEINGESTNSAILMVAPELDLFTVRVFPPVMTSEGNYDLDVTLKINDETRDSDTQSNAVRYSTGSSVDVMLVIDRSGSMSGSPITAAKNAAKLFVDLMALNDKIGVASFSSSASVNYPLTTITSDAIKQAAKNKINSISASGNTAIGYGLQQGLNQLVINGDSFHPWSMILLSDGYHNTGTHPYTVLPSIQSANIRVFTIGLGSVDQNLMSYIAHNSGGGGGEYYYAPNADQLLSIYNAISGVVKSESTVLNVEGLVNVGETVTHNVDIDSSINSATFTVTWESGDCTLALIRPDSSYVNPSDSDVMSYTTGTTYKTYTISNPMDGSWTMQITRTHASSLSYSCIVTVKTNVTLTCFTDKSTYKINEPIKIISTLTKGGIPITTATIEVFVKKPNGNIETINLWDDGYHDDGSANDGVYANSYANTVTSGSYTITISASGTISDEAFTRSITKSIVVSGTSTNQILVSPTIIDLGLIQLNTQHFIGLNISSVSTQDQSLLVSATDFIGDTGQTICADAVTLLTKRFTLPPGRLTRIYSRLLIIPDQQISGNYIGNIIIRSDEKSIKIPVHFQLIVDLIPPTINIHVPAQNEALQDGVGLQAIVTDASGVDWVKFSIRNPYGPQGTIINSSFEALPATNMGNNLWQYVFNTTHLPDGYYILFVNASDTLGNIGSTTVNFSIRNWAIIDMLPNTPSSKAGRTMPVKFAIRLSQAVDPAQPFVRNEELTITIYSKGHPETILQTSTYGTTSTDYRISITEEQYITNFKTLKQPDTYVVEIWRGNLFVSSFEFQTVK